MSGDYARAERLLAELARERTSHAETRAALVDVHRVNGRLQSELAEWESAEPSSGDLRPEADSEGGTS